MMVKNLKRFRKQVEREQGRLEALKCDFFPTTYVLPVGHSQTNSSFDDQFSLNIIYSLKNSKEIPILFGL